MKKENAKMKSLKGLIKHLHSVKEPKEEKKEEICESPEIDKDEHEMGSEVPGDKKDLKKAIASKKKAAF